MTDPQSLRVLALIALMALPTTLTAQSESVSVDHPYALKGKHGIELQAGLLGSTKSSTTISVDGVTTSSTASGFLGALAYSYWVENTLAVTVSAGASDASAETSTGAGGVTVETGTIVPLLFGVKYQPFRMTSDDALRPYGSVAIGPYLGYASNVYAGTATTTEAVSEAALGSRLGVGLDLSLSRSLVLGVGVGYRFVADFKNRIGAEKNYSGPDFLLTFGVVFGGS